MPKRATSTSFKKGNKAAVGHGAPIKEMRISTWIEKALDRSVPQDISPEAYEAQVTMRQWLADKMVLHAATDPDNALAYLREVLDRTEGKPKQSTDVTATVVHKVKPLAELTSEEILKITAG